MKKVAIIGAGGFTGQELLKILSKHEDVLVKFISSNAYAGKKLIEILPQLDFSKYNNLTFEKHPESVANLADIDLVFLATPDKASLEWVPKLIAAKKKVIDLSGSYRIKDNVTFEKYYGLSHEDDELLQEAIYGLTEFNRHSITTASLVSNPGCFASAALLPLLCLKQLAHHFSDTIIIDAKSGTSGSGGRNEKDSLAYSGVYENFRAYKIEGHQHTPEVKQEVEKSHNKQLQLRLTTHLLPLYRGILATIYIPLINDHQLQKKELESAFIEYSKKNHFLRYYANPNEIQLKNVQNTNNADFSFFIDNDILILFSAIDNLQKGAAGQAIQNMNLMFGFAEDSALR